MKNLALIFTYSLLFFLFSCSRDNRLADYNRIVDSGDKIIYYTRIADSFATTKIVDSVAHLQNLKSIFKRNIEPEYQRKFIAQHKIEIYKQGKLSGVLLLSGSKETPFVNFTCDKFGFGFKLTYGIGMSL
jgi:hypothetical protein